MVHVALEYMDLGSLAELKKRLGGYGVPPEYLSNITAQIMNGLNYLHKMLGAARNSFSGLQSRIWSHASLSWNFLCSSDFIRANFRESGGPPGPLLLESNPS